MKKIITNRLFMMTFVSDMLSNFGDVLYYLALMNYVLQIPEAKLAISLVTISESLPLLVMVFLGILGDRTRYKLRAILGTLLFRFILYLLVGCAMGFEPALWIVLLALVVNVLSDLAGYYENALYIPISLRLVADEEREAMYAFRQGTSSILKILFQSSGAVLITLMTYQQLAFMNAGTFALCFGILLFIRPALQRLLDQKPIQHKETEQRKSVMDDMWSSIRDSILTIREIPALKTSIVTIVCLNAIFAAEDSLMLLNIKEYSSFIFISPAMTLASLSIITLIGGILGSFSVTTLAKSIAFKNLINLSVSMAVLLFLSFYFHNIYLVFLVNFIVMILIGIFNPKMNALVVSSLPEDRIATISSGIDSFCMIGMVASRLLLSGLILIFSSQLISLLFLLISLILCLFTFWGNRGASF